MEIINYRCSGLYVNRCCLAELKHKASLGVNICLQACVIVHKIDLNE